MAINNEVPLILMEMGIDIITFIHDFAHHTQNFETKFSAVLRSFFQKIYPVGRPKSAREDPQILNHVQLQLTFCWALQAIVNKRYCVKIPFSGTEKDQ